MRKRKKREKKEERKECVCVCVCVCSDQVTNRQLKDGKGANKVKVEGCC